MCLFFIFFTYLITIDNVDFSILLLYFSSSSVRSIAPGTLSEVTLSLAPTSLECSDCFNQINNMV